MKCPKCGAKIYLDGDMDTGFDRDMFWTNSMERCTECGANFIVTDTYKLVDRFVQDCDEDGNVLEED